MPAMRLEILYGCGIKIKTPGFVKPLRWVLEAARVVNKDISAMMEMQPGQLDATAKQAGTLVGLAKTWGAVMDGQSKEVGDLEKKFPELVELRQKIAVVSAPELEMGRKMEQHVSQFEMPPIDQLLYGKGRYNGSNHIVDETGAFREEETITQEVCWFLWLYWQEVKIFRSRTDLLKFLREFQVRGITAEHLSKICRGIGLRFRGRGRPAK